MASSSRRASAAWPGRPCCAGSLGSVRAAASRSFKIQRLSEDMPIVVEIVDTRENLEDFLELVDSVLQDGLVTMEKATVRIYRSGK